MSRDGVRLSRAVLMAGVCHGFELSRTVTDPLSSGDQYWWEYAGSLASHPWSHTRQVNLVSLSRDL